MKSFEENQVKINNPTQSTQTVRYSSQITGSRLNNCISNFTKIENVLMTGKHYNFSNLSPNQISNNNDLTIKIEDTGCGSPIENNSLSDSTPIPLNIPNKMSDSLLSKIDLTKNSCEPQSLNKDCLITAEFGHYLNLWEMRHIENKSKSNPTNCFLLRINQTKIDAHLNKLKEALNSFIRDQEVRYTQEKILPTFSTTYWADRERIKSYKENEFWSILIMFSTPLDPNGSTITRLKRVLDGFNRNLSQAIGCMLPSSFRKGLAEVFKSTISQDKYITNDYNFCFEFIPLLANWYSAYFLKPKTWERKTGPEKKKSDQLAELIQKEASRFSSWRDIKTRILEDVTLMHLTDIFALRNTYFYKLYETEKLYKKTVNSKETDKSHLLQQENSLRVVRIPQDTPKQDNPDKKMIIEDSNPITKIHIDDVKLEQSQQFTFTDLFSKKNLIRKLNLSKLSIDSEFDSSLPLSKNIIAKPKELVPNNHENQVNNDSERINKYQNYEFEKERVHLIVDDHFDIDESFKVRLEKKIVNFAQRRAYFESICVLKKEDKIKTKIEATPK